MRYLLNNNREFVSLNLNENQSINECVGTYYIKTKGEIFEKPIHHSSKKINLVYNSDSLKNSIKDNQLKEIIGCTDNLHKVYVFELINFKFE